MKQTIRQVLDELGDSQINLGSETARETIASLVSVALKDKGTYTEYDDSEIEEQRARETWVCSICNQSTFDVDYDYIGSGTNHLGCELELEPDINDIPRIVDDAGVDIETGKYTGPSQTLHDQGGSYEIKADSDLQGQIYNEMTADGLPPGGDAQAVLESHKLADEIIDNIDNGIIYESPDGGKTVFRRPVADYDPKNKVHIDWKTKEPTGKTFLDYPWHNKEKENKK